MISDAQGNLYGTTESGGAGTLGTVYELSSLTHAFSTLATFSGANGDLPESGVILDSAGNLYGTTKQGGDLSLLLGKGSGTVFEVAAGTHALTTLVKFDDQTTGVTPFTSLIFDAAGNLYGTAAQSGPGGRGTVFKVGASIPHTLTVLASFTGANGNGPIAA